MIRPTLNPIIKYTLFLLLIYEEADFGLTVFDASVDSLSSRTWQNQRKNNWTSVLYLKTTKYFPFTGSFLHSKLKRVELWALQKDWTPNANSTQGAPTLFIIKGKQNWVDWWSRTGECDKLKWSWTLSEGRWIMVGKYEHMKFMLKSHKILKTKWYLILNTKTINYSKHTDHDKSYKL